MWSTSGGVFWQAENAGVLVRTLLENGGGVLGAGPTRKKGGSYVRVR